MTLKAAVVWSLAAHLALAAVPSPARSARTDPVFRPIEVTYLPPAEWPSRPVVRVRQIRRADRGPDVTKVVSPAAVPPPEPVAPPIRPAPIPPASPVRSASPPPVTSPAAVQEPVAPAGSPSGISVLSEAESAALREAEAASQHKQQVRRHLKARLQFPSDWLQGTVRLLLVLGPDGGVEEMAVLEASDRRLADHALAGARLAGPYPPFPKGMKRSLAQYEFLVQYKAD